MAVNLDKPQLWKADTRQSVDFYNRWFLRFAPKAFRETRVRVTEEVERAVADSDDLRNLSPEMLRSKPAITRTLRMCCCPPIAVDRLVGLAYTSKPLLARLEAGGLPARMESGLLDKHLRAICGVIRTLLDRDLFPWIARGKSATQDERHRAATVVADRLTGADANPIIRNAQEHRQLKAMGAYLARKGYKKTRLSQGADLRTMPPGTYTFHYSVATGSGGHKVNVSVDVVIQPHRPRAGKLPILIEAKSAGDFTNTNKRRKEEARKIAQLKDTLGNKVCYIVFLCGYFDAGYLGYEAQEGIDWVWEHRIEDLDKLGI
jgi:hypothetical protein